VPPAAPTPPPPAAPGTPGRRYPAPVPFVSLHNQTVRMMARTSMAGSQVRIRLQNALGLGTVQIGAAHIALRAEGSSIAPATDRALTFSGKPSATLYAGQTLVSDPVALGLPALAHVAVSLYIPGEAVGPTNHRFALHTTYLSKEGDFTGQADFPPADTRESWYWLAGIDVLAPADASALVTFGDSITDGDQSTLETDADWPDVLAARLQKNPGTAHVAVVNAGISGNRLLGDNNGGLARLFHDALDQPGIRWMTLLEGINDITGGSQNGRTSITADALIAAYRQIIEAAHLYGVKVIGCTLTPYGGSNVHSDYGETVREAVNQWIRTGGAFDFVVDFDAATRDPDSPKRYRAAVDSPDLLHPSNPGYKLMGDAFDLKVFQSRTVTTK
jgi:lysophospholipase L1-like esterase